MHQLSPNLSWGPCSQPPWVILPPRLSLWLLSHAGYHTGLALSPPPSPVNTLRLPITCRVQSRLSGRPLEILPQARPLPSPQAVSPPGMATLPLCHKCHLTLKAQPLVTNPSLAPRPNSFLCLHVSRCADPSPFLRANHELFKDRKGKRERNSHPSALTTTREKGLTVPILQRTKSRCTESRCSPPHPKATGSVTGETRGLQDAPSSLVRT